MQSKDLILRGKILWSAVLHLSLAGVIALLTLYLAYVNMKVWYEVEHARRSGWLFEGNNGTVAFSRRVFADFHFLAGIVSKSWWMWGIGLPIAWVCFECKVKSEGKPYLRLSAMSLAAFGLTAVSILVTSCFYIEYLFAVPFLGMARSEHVVRERLESVTEAVAGLDGAMAREDWEESRQHARDARRIFERLTHMGSAAPTLIALSQQAEIDRRREQLMQADKALFDAYQCLTADNADQVEHAKQAIERFHEAFDAIAQPPD